MPLGALTCCIKASIQHHLLNAPNILAPYVRCSYYIKNFFDCQGKRRFMPRKPLDMRKAYGRLSAYGKQKAPWGVWSWLFAWIPYAAEALVKRSVE